MQSSRLPLLGESADSDAGSGTRVGVVRCFSGQRVSIDIEIRVVGVHFGFLSVDAASGVRSNVLHEDVVDRFNTTP